MSWVTSAVVHTSMLVVLGSALTAFRVVAPEVPGSRIVVMSSMADVASPDSPLRETKPATPVELVETQPARDEPDQSTEAEESMPAFAPQPLDLTMSSVSLPEIRPLRRLGKNRSAASAATNLQMRRERELAKSLTTRIDLPSTSRAHPKVSRIVRAEPVEIPIEQNRTPAEIQLSSASTARQQSSNSVAQTVGTTPIKPARPISNPNPMYPPEAVQRRLEGRVILSVTIAATGKVNRVSVAESCGHQALDQAALDAVRRWRFSPATRDGEPVEWTARLPIRFRL